jgi:hypothetical protein
MTCPTGYVPTIKSEILTHQVANGGALLNMDGSTCGSDFCYILTGNAMNRNGTDRDYNWDSLFSIDDSSTLQCVGVEENSSNQNFYSLTTSANGTVCSPGYNVLSDGTCYLDTSTIPMIGDNYDAKGGIWMYALKYP